MNKIAKQFLVPEKLAPIIKKLQELRKLGMKDYEIESVIKQMNLPLGAQLAILGNYSKYMDMEVK